jgi:dihydrofolate reductase
MRPLRYSIGLTIDGCCDHEEGLPDRDTHAYAAETIAAADALIFGRVVYQMMEVWRPVAEGGPRPEWVEDWMVPFAEVIHRAKKYVVSDTLEKADWNAEIVRGKDLEATVRRLRNEDGRGLLTGGVTLPLALSRWGLIDEYEFVIHPRISGHGPTLLAGLATPENLRLTGRREFPGGHVALNYEAKR